MHDSIGGISVVSNSGNVHILYKTENMISQRRMNVSAI